MDKGVRNKQRKTIIIVAMCLFGCRLMATDTTLSTPEDFFKGIYHGMGIDVSSIPGGGIRLDKKSSGELQPLWPLEDLPFPVSRHAAVVWNGRIYVVGGTNGATVLSSVLSAPINTDGTIGAWTDEPNSLPVPRNNHGLVIWNRRLFVVGGSDGTTSQVSIYSAPLDTIGRVGLWRKEEKAMPVSVQSHGTVVVDGRIYIIGGLQGGTKVISDCYSAPINADGTIGAWSPISSLPNERRGMSCVVWNGQIYVFGGSVIGDVPKSENYRYNGSSWVSVSSLPLPLKETSAVVEGERIFIVGGNDSINPRKQILSAPINADGTIGSWETSTVSIGGGRRNVATVTWNGAIFIIGGEDGSGSKKTVSRAIVNKKTAISNWSPLTNDRYEDDSAGVVINGWLYIAGGYESAGVWRHKINEDGSLGPQITEASALPRGIRGHKMVGIANKLVLLGGSVRVGVGTYTDTNEVWVASLNDDGSVGVWLPGPSLKTQQGVTGHQVFVLNNRIYVSGGRSIFMVYDKVWSIGFSNSGELDLWREETPLPDQRAYHSMVAYNNRFYILGGSHMRNYDDVFTGFTAPINADGTIGAWSSLTYPMHWTLSNMFIFDNQLYLIGGWVEVADRYGPWKTFSAPINIDGTIGAWTRLADIPGTGPYDIPIAVHSSKGFYAFGESGIKYSGNTEYVSIGTYYSNQIDLGSNRWLKKLSYGSSEINGTSLTVLISTASSLSSYPNQYVALGNGDMINQYGRFISFKVVLSPNGIPATATPILTGLTVSHDIDLVNADRAPSLGSFVSVGSSSISFQLTDRSFDETEYLISISTISNPTNDEVSVSGIYGSSGTVQTITLSSLSPGVRYFIRARGKSSMDDTVGYFSNEISTRTSFIPSVPTLDYTQEPMFLSRGINEERVHIFSSPMFRVKYFSGDHTPPAPGWPKVDILKNGVPIPGSPFSMIEADVSTDYVGGKIYTFSKSFDFISDTMTYTFQARDVEGRIATWSGAEPIHGRSQYSQGRLQFPPRHRVLLTVPPFLRTILL